jgi:hypothetical protein
VSFSEDLTAAQVRLYVNANFPTQIWKILDDHEHKELFDGAYFVSAGTDRQTRTELMDLLEIKKMSLPLSRMLSEARKACRGGCDGSAKASSKRTKTKHKGSTSTALAYGLPPAIASTPRGNRPAPVSKEEAKKIWGQTLPGFGVAAQFQSQVNDTGALNAHAKWRAARKQYQADLDHFGITVQVVSEMHQGHAQIRLLHRREAVGRDCSTRTSLRLREFLKKRRRQVHRYHIFVALLADNFSLDTVALRLPALRRRRRGGGGGGGGGGGEGRRRRQEGGSTKAPAKGHAKAAVHRRCWRYTVEQRRCHSLGIPDHDTFCDYIVLICNVHQPLLTSLPGRNSLS